jgi:hypothetical protein
LDSEMPSILDLKFGPEVNAKIKVQTFYRNKRYLEIETKHPD